MNFLFILKYIILGIIEGLTEFLPVSSTGHLIIVTDLLQVPMDHFHIMFMIVVQLASILAVIILYWKRIWKLIKGLFARDPKVLRFWGAWIIGCIPAAVVGFLFSDLIDKYLLTVPTVAAALTVGGILMLITEKRLASRNKVRRLQDITPLHALIIGLAQCVSVWPGFSRSASTIMGGWCAGLSTAVAADFSFFLAIPIMIGASGYSVVKFLTSPAGQAALDSTQIIGLVLGCLAAFLVAVAAVKAFLHYLKKKPLRWFAIYRFFLAAVLLVLMLTGVI